MVFTREELERSSKTNKKRNRIITFTSIGVVLLVLVFMALWSFTDVIRGLSTELKSASTSSDWAMFRRDMTRTGAINPGDALPRGEIKWTFATRGGIYSSPAVVNGTVYVGSRDGNVYAVSAETGDKLWAFKTGSWVESSPTVVGGVVYIGSNDGNLYALDAATGARLWAFSTRYSIRSSPAAADGIIYFGSDDYCIYAVDAETGKQIWKYETGTQVTSSPVVTDGIVVVGSADGVLYTLNARTGKARLEFNTSSTFVSTASVNGTTAYFSDTSHIYAADIRARNWPLENELIVYWRILYIYGVAPRPPTSSGFIWSYSLGKGIRQSSSPAMFEDRLYFGSGNNLIALDINTRKPAWTMATKDLVSAAPAVTAKVVYAGSQDGKLYAVDRATGARLWDVATGDSIISSPALANGVIYVGSLDGNLYAIK